MLIAVLIFLFSTKSNESSETVGMNSARHKLDRCPNCGEEIIADDGEVFCFECGEEFIYVDQTVYIESVHHSLYGLLLASLSGKFHYMSDEPSNRNFEFIQKKLVDFLEPTDVQIEGLKGFMMLKRDETDRFDDHLQLLVDYANSHLEMKNALYTFLVELMHGIAEKEEFMNEAQQQALYKVHELFGAYEDSSYEESEEVEWQNRSDLARAYEILQCSETDSDAVIKKKYRELSKKYHPDVLASKDVAPEIVAIAEKKFIELKEAYDLVSKK